jgi:putative SOS response-associated peptidase YedK
VWAGNGNRARPSACDARNEGRASERLARYYGRVPVIVHSNDFDRWLRGDSADVDVLPAPYPADVMMAAAGYTRVNNPRNEGPELLTAV